MFLVNGNMFLENLKYLADFWNMLDAFLKQLQLETSYQM